MTGASASLPYEIEVGIKGIDANQNCEIKEASFYDEKERAWCLRLTLISAATSQFIPRESLWFLWISENYPYGEIKLYPAREGGISVTFPHQALNEDKPSKPWRLGKPCLEEPFRFRSLGHTFDPLGDSDLRLRWYLERALAWLDAAANNRLAKAGDLFELPQYKYLDLREPIKVIHDESISSFKFWDGNMEGAWGRAVLTKISGIDRCFVVKDFKSSCGTTTIRSWQGRYSKLKELEADFPCFWWLWPSPIVVKPWKVPCTWGELFLIAKACDVDAEKTLRFIAELVRGQSISFLLLGYPIPRIIGEEPKEIFWQGLILPELKDTENVPNGWRPNKKGKWERDRRIAFAQTNTLNYIHTENWHPDRLQARGKLLQPMVDLSISVIGAGALGASMAEILARCGLKKIHVVDGDILGAGNIGRHVLTLNDIGKNKGEALKDLLHAINPCIEVTLNNCYLPAAVPELERLFSKSDVVIDCTGSNDVLHLLDRAWWPVPKLFLSASVGFKAERLFIYSSFGNSASFTSFLGSIEEQINKEKGALAEHGEALEGAGCWSPLFPARYDNLLLASATCIKVLEKLCVAHPEAPEIRIYEAKEEAGEFVGYALAHYANIYG